VVKKYTNTYTGSPYTMAPEIENGSEYGKEVDIFSLGAIYYELLTG
jgi:serine/threonine protein kinase